MKKHLSFRYNFKLVDQLHKDIPGTGEPWSYRRHMLSLLYIYLCYAEAQIYIFEEQSKLLIEYGHKNQTKYTDRQYKRPSSALGFYIFASICTDAIKKLLPLKSDQSAWDGWLKNMKLLRNRTAAHPTDEIEGRQTRRVVLSKRTSDGYDEGKITFNLINHDDLNNKRSVTINPLEDFDKLVNYVNESIGVMRTAWLGSIEEMK